MVVKLDIAPAFFVAGQHINFFSISKCIQAGVEEVFVRQWVNKNLSIGLSRLHFGPAGHFKLVNMYHDELVPRFTPVLASTSTA